MFELTIDLLWVLTEHLVIQGLQVVTCCMYTQCRCIKLWITYPYNTTTAIYPSTKLYTIKIKPPNTLNITYSVYFDNFNSNKENKNKCAFEWLWVSFSSQFDIWDIEPWDDPCLHRGLPPTLTVLTPWNQAR